MTTEKKKADEAVQQNSSSAVSERESEETIESGKTVEEDQNQAESISEKDQTDAQQDLKTRLESEKDRVLRLSAEFENYKKRKQREIDDFRKFANETLFKNLLTVVDNLERAIDAAHDAKPDAGGLLEGVRMTHKEILKLFENFNVKPVDARAQAFDPNFHQAVTREETNEFPDNTVTRVLQKGYLLHDRLIRPAMVVVAKNLKQQTERTD